MNKISDTRVVVTSLLVSMSDVTLNLVVGIVTGSSVMFSQALQGLSDLVTAAVVFLGVRRSKRAPDENHPFGYGREIFFWVLVAGIFMFFGTGGISLLIGLQQVINPSALDTVWLAFAMLSFGFITNGYSFSVAVKRMREEDASESIMRSMFSSSLIETKATLLVDFMGTLAAGFGLLALGVYAITNNVIFDGIGAMTVGVSMMLASLLLIRDVKALIVGRAAGAKAIKQIKQSTLAVQGVLEVLDLRTMYLGSSRLLVVVEVHLADGLETNEIEHLSDKIKDQIKQTMPSATRVQVEVETPDNELLN